MLSGCGRSYRVLEQRGNPQEHPLVQTQMEVVDRHQELLAEEQNVAVRAGTALQLTGLMDQHLALQTLKDSLTLEDSLTVQEPEGSHALCAPCETAAACWAQIGISRKLMDSCTIGEEAESCSYERIGKRPKND